LPVDRWQAINDSRSDDVTRQERPPALLLLRAAGIGRRLSRASGGAIVYDGVELDHQTLGAVGPTVGKCREHGQAVSKMIVEAALRVDRLRLGELVLSP
jgi:hypothetical protein